MKWILSCLTAIVVAGLIAHAETVGVPPSAQGDFSTINQRWLAGLAGGQNQNMYSGLTASTSGNQAGATRLPVNYAVVSLDQVANPGDSVQLPICKPPFNIEVINNGANAANFYSRNNSSDTINGNSPTTPFLLPSGNTGIFICPQRGQWNAMQVSPALGGTTGGSTIVAGATPTSGIASGNVIGSAASLVTDSGVPYSQIALINTGVNFTSVGASAANFTAVQANSIGALTPGTGVFSSLNSPSLGAATPGTAVVTTLQTTGAIRAPVRSAVSVTDTISATADYFVCPLNSTTAATENLPVSPSIGLTFLIKDCSGSAASHSITIVPAAGTIDGAGNFVMNINFQSIAVTYTGAQWSLN